MNDNFQVLFRWLRKNSIVIALMLVLPAPYLFSETVVLNYMDMYPYLRVVRDFSNHHLSLFFTETRTNLFPLILFVNFKLWGTDLMALKYLNIAVLAGLLIECLILGKLLFKNNSGIITAILVCTSYTFVHFVYFPHIDLLLLTALILCLIVLFVALERKPESSAWMFFSGVLIGLSFLLKESAIWLLFFTPVYLILRRATFKQIVKKWCWQLLPLGLIAVPMIYAHHQAFYYRYIYKLIFWKALILSQDPERLIDYANFVTRPDYSVLRVFTFPLAPVFWQWDSMFPVPDILIVSEQILILTAGLCYFLKKTPETETKMFLLAIFIVFLPRYIVVAISGYKIRQVLITFFIFYPILGNLLYNSGIRMKTALLPYTQLQRVQASMVLLMLAFYFIRMLFLTEGIAYTLHSAEFHYQRRVVLPLHAEIK